MSYQGWKNWETWNVVLWFDNDRGLYETYRAYRRRRKFTAATAKELVLETLPNGTPDMQDLSRAQLHDAYAKVSWSEVARSFNSE